MITNSVRILRTFPLKSTVLHNTTHKTEATCSQRLLKTYPSVLQELCDILLLLTTWVQIEVGNWLGPCTELPSLETLIFHLPNSNYSHNPVRFALLPPLSVPTAIISVQVLISNQDLCLRFSPGFLHCHPHTL